MLPLPHQILLLDAFEAMWGTRPNMELFCPPKHGPPHWPGLPACNLSEACGPQASGWPFFLKCLVQHLLYAQWDNQKVLNVYNEHISTVKLPAHICDSVLDEKREPAKRGG